MYKMCKILHMFYKYRHFSCEHYVSPKTLLSDAYIFLKSNAVLQERKYQFGSETENSYKLLKKQSKCNCNNSSSENQL